MIARYTPLFLVAAGVLPALLYGVGLMLAYNTPTAMPLSNGVAALLCFGLLPGVGPWLRARLMTQTLLLASFILAILSSTLWSAGSEGVHRWVSLGPVRLHISSVLTPVLLLCVVHLTRRARWKAVALLVAITQGLQVFQPDAGQATAFGAAVVLLMLRTSAAFGWAERGLIGLIACTGLALAWMQPAPLGGVAMVEDMIARAFALNGLVGLGAVATLAMLPGVALWVSRSRRLDAEADGPGRVAGEVLAVYFVATIGVVFLGEYPVPVLGHGASPILGAILGLGLLHPAPSVGGEGD